MTDRDQLHARFSSDDEIDAAIKRAVRDTLAQHGRLGQRVVVWIGERPVWIVPDEAPNGAEGA